MEQKKISNVLKVTTVITAFAVTLIFFWYIPVMAKKMSSSINEGAEFLYYPCLIFAWVIATLIYLILWRFWTVCREIGNNNSFSMANAKAITWISRYAIMGGVFSLVCLIGLSFSGYMKSGWFVLFLFLIFASSGVAIVTYCLSHLVQNAALIKEQNDLTI